MLANIIVSILAAVILVPTAMFCLECALALVPLRLQTRKASSHKPRLAVLMPAHNEADVIEQSLRSLLPGLEPHDRVVVIADNCSDRTPLLAERSGCEVIYRHDETRIGKGFALDFGFKYLSQQPPDVVVVLDADCQVEPGTIYHLAAEAFLTDRPIQGWYRFESVCGANHMQTLASLGLCFKNHVRPLGSLRLGMPCQLHGSGMAFPWETLKKVALANSTLVEDLQLGIDLAVVGAAPRFLPQAKLRTRMPKREANFLKQRKRWEHGHLALITAQFPRLIGEAFRQRRLELLWLALDLTIPPLSLLALVWLVAVSLIGIVFLWTEQLWPLLLLGFGGLLLIFGIIGGWVLCSREDIPWTVLWRVPWYIFKKLGVYASFIRNRERSWVRTERDHV